MTHFILIFLLNHFLTLIKVILMHTYETFIQFLTISNAREIQRHQNSSEINRWVGIGFLQEKNDERSINSIVLCSHVRKGVK